MWVVVERYEELGCEVYGIFESEQDGRDYIASQPEHTRHAYTVTEILRPY